MIPPFQVLSKDLMGRTGLITTRRGSFQTPHMFPVVDPNRPELTQHLLDGLDTSAVMTNAYLLKKGWSAKGTIELHEHLGFKRTIATDSGAYQILEFGEVSVTPREIVQYEEEIGSDIAVILDVPTGYRAKLAEARATVDETIRRADEAIRARTKDDVLWVGPIQGGVHLSEVERSAKEMGRRDFAIHALGSPTQLMEAQRYEPLVDMIIAAKRNLPIERPFHLFGAGHPASLPFFVALGCDLFDSAAYALYAKQGKYFTAGGTLKLEEMQELPCQCTTCRTRTADSLNASEPEEREFLLSRHNLHMCISELRRIREAIRTGRLWDLMEIRSNGHPALKRCFERVASYSDLIGKYDPAVKSHGVYHLSPFSQSRPEIQRYHHLIAKIQSDQIGQSIVLLPAGWRRPFHQDPGLASIVQELRDLDTTSIIFYSLAFGPVPLELDETFPIPHTDVYDSREKRDLERAAIQVYDYVQRLVPKMIVFVSVSESLLSGRIEEELRRRVSADRFEVLPLGRALSYVSTNLLSVAG